MSEKYETADAVRVDVEFPEHWGTPQGDPGTPERRSWLIGCIRADDNGGAGANPAGALQQARAIDQAGQ